ncbi:hypothetical protein HYFRA_00007420 [Hymenoscyphus fraxineus]|uniref:Uncharacterized protein n=1 Tax=Hymenoscyphus fraxineus TaxID=746836 RepID=A0A9N9KQ93_9HELO|nr:hypothetical protein HYFRA_00007420 [Hymenoscyphus fraxineus]
MPHARSGPRHHCPGLTGKVDNYPGNCRHNGLWCETHENYCPRHDWSHMKKWPCPACEKELRMNDRRKDKDRKRDDGDGDGDGDRKNNPKPVNAKNRKQIAKAARQDKQAGNKKPKTKNKNKTKEGSKDGTGNSQVKVTTRDDVTESESDSLKPLLNSLVQLTLPNSQKSTNRPRPTGESRSRSRHHVSVSV